MTSLMFLWLICPIFPATARPERFFGTAALILKQAAVSFSALLGLNPVPRRRCRSAFCCQEETMEEFIQWMIYIDWCLKYVSLRAFSRRSLDSAGLSCTPERSFS